MTRGSDWLVLPSHFPSTSKVRVPRFRVRSVKAAHDFLNFARAIFLAGPMPPPPTDDLTMASQTEHESRTLVFYIEQPHRG